MTDSDLRSDRIDAKTPTFEVYKDDETPPIRLQKMLTIMLVLKLIFPLGGGGGAFRWYCQMPCS